MVTEFLTTTLLGGIIYDLMKIGVSNSYELAKKSLKDYTSSEEDIRHLKLILEKDILTKSALTKEKIIDILDNSEDISFLIKKVKNININHVDKIIISSKERDIDKVEFENNYPLATGIGGIYIFIGVLLTFYFALHIHFSLFIIIPFILLFLWIFIAPYVSIYVTVYNDRLILYDNTIYYKDISSCEKKSDNILVLKLYNTGEQVIKEIRLSEPEDLDFIKHWITNYSK
ncbi:hypothetical protein [Arcobacter sp. F2176]|uniref:hypothetical protein n=1 Tax=Arcobacter sp. F2176 TaxID=2044511 RepID=UPI00100A6F6B|nr:hypothetical protein [Arcobacter sp. F2176]RXJ80968.1 hypothetical protein CRU95_10105 [Arcobacter sp. F2176]